MFDIDKILNSKIGNLSNTIHIEFKKTVKVKEYETEAVSVGIDVEVEELDGMDREMVYTLLEAQAEYTVLANLVTKGRMPQQEFSGRVQALETYVSQMAGKYKSITGKDAETVYGSQFQMPNNTGAMFTQMAVEQMPKPQQTQAVGVGAVPFGLTVTKPMAPQPVMTQPAAPQPVPQPVMTQTAQQTAIPQTNPAVVQTTPATNTASVQQQQIPNAGFALPPTKPFVGNAQNGTPANMQVMTQQAHNNMGRNTGMPFGFNGTPSK